MRELRKDELKLPVGALSAVDQANAKLLTDLGNNAAWGAAVGTVGGPVGMAAGALGGIGQGVIAHGPVNVPVPVLIGPNFNLMCNPPAITSGCQHY